MDIKGLTSNLLGKTRNETEVIKASTASSDQAPHTSSQLQPQTLKALQAMLQTLQLGKIFDVIITRVEGNMVTLQVPGAPLDAPILQAEMKNPPPVGTRFTLQLTDDIQKPGLKVIANPNSPQDAVSRHLRTGLQQQQPSTPLWANLALLAKHADRLPASLPEVVVETARQVVEQFSQAMQIRDATGLKRALQQAGPFLESTLARQNPARPGNTPPSTADRVMQVLTQTVADQARISAELTEETRLAIASQTLQLMSQAMQRQPVADVRANLLRLAAVIRAAQERIQLDEQPSEEIVFNRKAQAEAARVAATPPPTTLMQSKAAPSAAGSGLPPQAKPAAPGTVPTEPTLVAVRSQAPQPQAMVQPSLAGILDSQSALEELLGQVEGALARIQVQQLQTAATEQQNRPVWVMELPVRTEHGVDVFDIRIQRDTEQHAEDDPAAPWSVTLAFDLDKLGPIRAQVSLYGKDRVSTVFWAERQETSTYFNQHLDRLEGRLKLVGLEVVKLDCRCGRPTPPPPSNEPRLVDEKV